MPGLSQRFIKTNGIQIRITEMGEGPLVLMIHGWPESWYSWRHQMVALADAGYHVVAPDMRGYGKSDAPETIADYDIEHISKDIIGILDALEAETAVLVGHDWGAVVNWPTALLYPERFTALVNMSVPHYGRGEKSVIDVFKRQFGDNFFYILYFQEPELAEKEFDADPRGILSRLYTSPQTPRESPELTNPKMCAGGWIPRLGAPKELPAWLSQADLDYYVNEFEQTGFRGGINYYRNFHRNWEITPQLTNAKIKQPTLFIAGAEDMVIGGANKEALEKLMKEAVPDLRDVVLVPKIGHWIQQEAPEETNRAILKFLDSLK
ncbi:MAG: alpha/beta hydrolase [SAR324 cluster bacterium]|nr:alpha/beta hydrolase [SAR324 cluster bacterium]